MILCLYVEGICVLHNTSGITRGVNLINYSSELWVWLPC